MRSRHPHGQRPGTDRARPTTSVRHTWWGVTTPRRTRTVARRRWVGILVLAALAVASPVWLWLLTEPLAALGPFVVAAAALTGRLLGASPDLLSVAGRPDPPIAGPPDRDRARIATDRPSPRSSP